MQLQSSFVTNIVNHHIRKLAPTLWLVTSKGSAVIIVAMILRSVRVHDANLHVDLLLSELQNS